MSHSLNGAAHSAFNVRDYGAAGDGAAADTCALQAAIDACHAQGGGTVVLPAGRYCSGSLSLRSHVTLHLDAGAVLLGSEDPVDYPIIASRWEGNEQLTHAPLLGGRDLTNVAITGRGTIDGRGAGWWERFRSGALAYPRPRLIALTGCTDVLIEGVTATHSPSWTINPVGCDNVTIHHITVINPPDSPNTDGINPDSCSNVRISDCYVSAGDDCITIKSGNEAEGQDRRAPSRNITITNCTLARGHGGVVIGSEMSGGVQNVVISNCLFVGTDRGIRLKSRRGRGGVVEDVRVTNVVMTDVLCPFTINLHYAPGAWGDPAIADRGSRPVTDGTPRFRRIHLSHLTARHVRVAAAYVVGLAEMRLEDISLCDVAVSLAPDAEAGVPEMADDLEPMRRAGLVIGHVHRLRLHNVEVTGQLGPALRLTDSTDVDISACTTSTPPADAPVFRMTNVDSAFVHGCQAGAETDVFLSVEGEKTWGIALRGNHLARARQPVHVAAEVRPEAVWSDDLTYPSDNSARRHL